MNFELAIKEIRQKVDECEEKRKGQTLLRLDIVKVIRNIENILKKNREFQRKGKQGDREASKNDIAMKVNSI